MYKIYDEADQFRIELSGKFNGDPVVEVARRWKEALSEPSQRTFTVDISSLTAYDSAAGRLLRDMYRHGMQIAARNPEALAILNELSSPAKKGPALVLQAKAAGAGK